MRMSAVPIKTWNCPGCHRSFIVDAEATRDTCPWCNATVEQKGETIQLVSETPKPPEPPPATGTQPSANAGTQNWWPFEYSS